MALPPIGYATTAGNVRVAFHALGDGPAVVMLWPYHMNHLALNWNVPLHRGAIEFFARYFKVVNLDFRGAGLSERRIDLLSLDTFADDLDAVLRTLGIDRVALVAVGPATVAACHIAATSPARVSSLVLLEGGESETNRRVLSLRHLNPQAEAHMRGALFAGIDDRHAAVSLAAVARAALEPDALRYWENVLDSCELLELAACVTVPVLCVDVADGAVIPPAAAQALVNHLPQATRLSVPGRSPIDVWRDRAGMQQVARFIAKHFGIERAVARAQRQERKSRIVHPAGLSDREADVLRLLAAGKSNQRIAAELFVSVNTVSHHLRNIFAKTGTVNRTEAASFAHRQRLTADDRPASSAD